MGNPAIWRSTAAIEIKFCCGGASMRPTITVTESRIRGMSAKQVSRTIDHLVLCVSQLERARASYRAMGFTLTPRAKMPFGTNNSLAQLPGRNFLELLAVGESAEVPAHELPQRFSFGATI